MKMIPGIVLLLLISGCGAPQGDVQDVTQDKALQDAGRRSTPVGASAGASVRALDRDVAAGRYGLIDEVYVQQSGEVVFHSKYDHDYDSLVEVSSQSDNMNNFSHPKWHPYYDRGHLHTTLSITKSIASLLVGVAEDDGKLPAVGEARLIDHIDGRYRVPLHEAWWGDLTIEDVLAMRMNLEWDESRDVFEQWRTHDWIQFVLDKPMRGPPGEAYAYNSGASHLLSAIVQHAVGMSVEDYAQEKLFGPMGVTDVFWKTAPSGLSHTQGGLYIGASDLAKLCTLIEGRGVWDGQRLISADFLDRSFTKRTTFDESSGYYDYGMGYGYQWWLGDGVFGPGSINGDGYGGQRLTCLPDEELAIVVYSWNVSDLARPDLVKDPEDAFHDIHIRIRDEILPFAD